MLWESWSETKHARPQSSGGKRPLSRLALRLSSTNLVWLDSVAGTGPVRKFSLRFNHSRFARVEMPLGMVPYREQCRGERWAGGVSIWWWHSD